MAEHLQIDWLGLVPYGEALELQARAVEERKASLSPDRLLLLEHPPVVTFGRSARDEQNLRVPRAELLGAGVEIHRVARGGDVTYHAPGQLVGYLIADLAARGEPDVHRLLRRIEAGLIDALSALGVPGDRREGMTGVFVAGADRPARKIASIGLGLRGWVTHHGFALNSSVDLAGFEAIVPCGLHGVEMTSVARELSARPDAALFERTREAVAESFARSFA